MSVRSHYSANSYLNQRATSGARAAKKMCLNCEYRIMVEENKDPNTLTPTQIKREQRRSQPPNPDPVQGTKPEIVPEEGQPKPKNIIQKFGEYVAKNQAALKASGETSLMEDLSDMGKNMFNKAGTLGQEEIDRINKKSSKEQKRESDDEIMDFMVGKGRGR